MKYGDTYSISNLLMQSLGISKSNAYKKLSGQVALSIEELEKLHQEFKLPLSSFLEGQSKFSFQLDVFDKQPSHPVDYIQNMATHFTEYLKYSDVEFIYMSNEIPIFHLFNFPELLRIRLYMWDYTNWNTDYLTDEFDLRLYADRQKDFEIARASVLSNYQNINGIELWNTRFIDSLCEQIKYLIESYILTSSQDIDQLCESLSRLYDYLARLSESGLKSENLTTTISIYNNQLIMTPLLIYGKSKHFDALYTMMDMPNYVFCNEPQVNIKMREWIEKILTHSKLISKQGRKDRKQFLIQLQRRINAEVEEIRSIARYMKVK